MTATAWTCDTLGPDHADAVVDVLSAAFGDYPVMRYVLAADAAKPQRVRQLVALFVGQRILRGHPLVGVRDGEGRLLGAMTLTSPGDWPADAAILALRKRTWRLLGDAARARYDAFSTAVSALSPPGRWWHVNMVGVLPDHQRRGIAAALLGRAHAMAAADGDALGVELTTEHARNVALYRHLGYGQVGCVQVSDALTSWTLARPTVAKADFRGAAAAAPAARAATAGATTSG